MDPLLTTFGEAIRTTSKRVTQDQQAHSATISVSQLLSTLASVAVFAFILLLIFVIVRPRAGWKYAPRSQSKILPSNLRTPSLPSGQFNWLPDLWAIPDTFILSHQSLDSYLFLRFLKISVIACLVGCCIIWPVLLPVHATGGAKQMQLDILTMSNVESEWRFFAHAGCAWTYFCFLMYLITRESMFFVGLRHAHLMQPSYTSKLPSRTVLFMSVPDDYLNEARVRELLGPQVVRVWLPTHTKELGVLVEFVKEIAMRLEGAETKLIRAANKVRLVASKKGGYMESNSAMAHWFTDLCPTHRLGVFGIRGQKVNSIDWYRAELERVIPKVKAGQQKHRAGEAKKLGAVFVEFTSPTEAQAACQTLTHHRVLTMAPRLTGIHPSDVIWANLSIRSWERNIRSALSTAFVITLIIFWSFPVAIISIISNINFIVGPTGKLPWLDWILRMPHFLLGIITGLLPTIMLTVLMSFLPIVLRFAARLGGSPTYSDIEHTVQNYYFGFQVIQVFLATTLTSAVTSTIVTIINDPSSVITLLSASIPRTSSFYLSYFVVQGLGVSTRILVSITGFFTTPLLAKTLGSTPRKIWLRWNQLSRVGWGTLYPVYTNLLVIAICYSCIAPLVTGFAAIGLFLFYFAYRYNFLYVYDMGIDMKGLGYARALQHLFVGLYISELCLIGLFSTRLESIRAIGPFVLMALLLFVTALYHISLNTALTPLINFLPKTFETEEGQSLSSLPYEKTNTFTKFFRGHVQTIPRPLVPWVASRAGPIDDLVIRDAYLPPEVWTDVPRLLIPRDEMGVSLQEYKDNERIGVPCTDAAAYLDEKNKIVVEDDVMAAICRSAKDQLIKNC